MKLSKRWKVKVRTGTENVNNNYTKIAQRTNTGQKKGEKTIWASKYRASKAGHIIAKDNGGQITWGPPNTGQQKLDT